jgi:hypothetical protein
MDEVELLVECPKIKDQSVCLIDLYVHPAPFAVEVINLKFAIRRNIRRLDRAEVLYAETRKSAGARLGVM